MRFERKESERETGKNGEIENRKTPNGETEGKKCGIMTKINSD